MPVSFDCIDGMCIDPGDGSGAYATLGACMAVCNDPNNITVVTDDCPLPAGEEWSSEDCTGDLAGEPFDDNEFTVEDELSAFGDRTLDSCFPFIGQDGYEVEDEWLGGCCECPCVPNATDVLHAAISSDGACGWNGTIELHRLPQSETDPLRPDIICWEGTILGDNDCTLYVRFCCHCDGPASLGASTQGPSACAEDCCTVYGTCTPLNYEGDFCCNWLEGFGPTPTDCGFCCVHVQVTL